MCGVLERVCVYVFVCVCVCVCVREREREKERKREVSERGGEREIVREWERGGGGFNQRSSRLTESTEGPGLLVSSEALMVGQCRAEREVWRSGV